MICRPNNTIETQPWKCFLQWFRHTTHHITSDCVCLAFGWHFKCGPRAQQNDQDQINNPKHNRSTQCVYLLYSWMCVCNDFRIPFITWHRSMFVCHALNASRGPATIPKPNQATRTQSGNSMCVPNIFAGVLRVMISPYHSSHTQSF